jgi:hypothetical protein
MGLYGVLDRSIAEVPVLAFCENCLAVNDGRRRAVKFRGRLHPGTTEEKMFRTKITVLTCRQCGSELRGDKRYGNEDGQPDAVRRLIPWLVALAITAVTLFALAEGYLA